MTRVCRISTIRIARNKEELFCVFAIMRTVRLRSTDPCSDTKLELGRNIYVLAVTPIWDFIYLMRRSCTKNHQDTRLQYSLCLRWLFRDQITLGAVTAVVRIALPSFTILLHGLITLRLNMLRIPTSIAYHMIISSPPPQPRRSCGSAGTVVKSICGLWAWSHTSFCAATYVLRLYKRAYS